MLKITLIALGNKMPDWVNQGFNQYAKRLQDGVSFRLIEIPLAQRSKSIHLQRTIAKEMEAMQSAIPTGSYVIALSIDGKAFSSHQLAENISRLQHINSHLCFLIGGPEGLSTEMLARCDEQWSLSKLTLPHPFVRVLFIEAIYRAWSILKNHPYHK